MRDIGVLALQGDFDAHILALREAGAAARLIRRAPEIEEIAGLVIPGGESTVLLRLMRDMGMFEPLRQACARGLPVFGTCAGAILLARRVTGPGQPSLEAIDIDIERNAYGRQRESFETADGSVAGSLGAAGGRPGAPLELVLIRAPVIRRCGPTVEVLARHGDHPVLVREGNVLAATFHPELGRDRRVHGCFLEMAGRAMVAA